MWCDESGRSLCQNSGCQQLRNSSSHIVRKEVIILLCHIVRAENIAISHLSCLAVMDAGGHGTRNTTVILGGYNSPLSYCES